MFHGILDASKLDGIGNIAGYLDHKNIAQSLVKNVLRWNPGIGTA